MLRHAETTRRSPSTGQTGWCPQDMSVANRPTYTPTMADGLLQADTGIDNTVTEIKIQAWLSLKTSGAEVSLLSQNRTMLASMLSLECPNYQAFQGSSIGEGTANLQGFHPLLGKLSSIQRRVFTPPQIQVCLNR